MTQKGPKTIMLQPPQRKLSAAEAIPLLEQAIEEGELHANSCAPPGESVLDWLNHVKITLSEIEDLSMAVVESFGTVCDQSVKTPRAGGAEVPGIHIFIAAEITKILKSQARLLRARTQPLSTVSMKPTSVGTKIFIGHGRSASWLELQRFIEVRLRLEAVEFNSIPTAGMTIVDRLKAMLNSVCFAFLVMSTEDHVGKSKEANRARQNVIHEIGLFQGRLGFDKAIILLEDGCSPFSNIDGLVYIPFPLGNISASFEKIRGTLEAHGLVKALTP
jgi:predicted nucleotide-binding protein